MITEVAGTNLTTNLTAAAATEATNVTEDASQNEIQQLNMTNYLDGKWMFSLVREFPLNIGVLYNQHLTVFNASQLGTCVIDALLSFHYQTYHRRLTTTSAYD